MLRPNRSVMPAARNDPKPTRQNIKELLNKAKQKYENQKNQFRRLIEIDARNTQQIELLTNRMQTNWEQIENIRVSNITPDLIPLQTEIKTCLEQCIRTRVLSHAGLQALSRNSPFEMNIFIEYLKNKRNGVSNIKIEEVKFFKYKNPNNIPDEIEICSVCHEEYVEGVEAIKLECKHIYHRGCITKWLKNKLSCPMCKGNVVLEKVNEINEEIENKNNAEKQEEKVEQNSAPSIPE